MKQKDKKTIINFSDRKKADELIYGKKSEVWLKKNKTKQNNI